MVDITCSNVLILSLTLTCITSLLCQSFTTADAVLLLIKVSKELSSSKSVPGEDGECGFGGDESESGGVTGEGYMYKSLSGDDDGETDVLSE